MTGKMWPGNVLPSLVMFQPDIPSTSGGPSYGGQEQVVFSSAGRWKAQLKMSVRRTIAPTVTAHNRILAARAMVAYMKGRANTIYIGPYDFPNSPAFLAGLSAGPVLTTFSDSTTFSDGTKFAQPVTPAVLTAPAPVGSLSATVTMLDTRQTAQAGQYFGFGTSELYLIDTSTALGSGEFALTFWPILRNPYPAGQPVNFDMPTCEMRLATDSSGALNFPLGFGTDMALDLVEAI
jgi:hypothetical protein